MYPIALFALFTAKHILLFAITLDGLLYFVTISSIVTGKIFLVAVHINYFFVTISCILTGKTFLIAVRIGYFFPPDAMICDRFRMNPFIDVIGNRLETLGYDADRCLVKVASV